MSNSEVGRVEELTLITRNTDLAKRFELQVETENIKACKVSGIIPDKTYQGCIILGHDLVMQYLDRKQTLINANRIVVYHEQGTPDDEINFIDLPFGCYVRGQLSCRLLEIRLRNILKNIVTSDSAIEDAFLTCNGFSFYPERAKLYFKDGEIALTVKEIGVLRLLMSSKGAIISRDRFLDAIYPDDNILPRTVDCIIKKLRAKIRKISDVEHIETIYGIGYRME